MLLSYYSLLFFFDQFFQHVFSPTFHNFLFVRIMEILGREPRSRLNVNNPGPTARGLTIYVFLIPEGGEDSLVANYIISYWI